jgi:hypothetical protein
MTNKPADGCRPHKVDTDGSNSQGYKQLFS